MNNFFDGKTIREEILESLRAEVAAMEEKPKLCVFYIGTNEVSAKYVEIKKKVAESLDINFELIKLDENSKQEEISAKIDECNKETINKGIMIQIPVPAHLDQDQLVRAIAPEKDVDGLRYCLDEKSDFLPPVVLAILEAIYRSGKKLDESKVAIVGHGFLVGEPLARFLVTRAESLSIADHKTRNLKSLTLQADILISATGKGGLIKPDMIKEGAVLIDAGTSETNGELAGDIEREGYSKASYYTPVPGGIGPVTVALLMKNLIESAKRSE